MMTVEEKRDRSSDDEDEVVNKIIEEGVKDEFAKDEELHEFDELSVDFKLERLQNLVKQSQVFSSIISDTLLENSLAKKKAREEEARKASEATEENADEPPKKKSKKGRKSGKKEAKQANIMDFYSKKEVSEETKIAKSKIEQSKTNSTIKQPSLVTGAEMRDYQLEGTEWLITLYENGLNGILADEMGLGKTIQSIALLAFLYEQGIKGSFLIAAPLSTVGNWVKEFQRFAPSLPVLGYVGSKDERKELREKHFNKGDKAVIITSYEIILRDFEHLNRISWKFLLVDEGHRLKNVNCKLIRELKRLKTSNRLLITGTPLQNNLNELWSLLNFILPDIFHDLELFQKWFDFSSLNSLANDVKDDKTKKLIDSKIQESLVNNLHTILKPFLLRRLKKNVIKNLPSKREYIVYGTLTQKQSELYKDALHRSLKRSVRKFALQEHIDVNKLSFTKKDIDQFIFKKFDSDYVDFEDELGTEDRMLRSEKQEKLELHQKANLNKKDKKLEKIWDYISKYVDGKQLQNLMMQLRLICNSPYLFYFPWESEYEVDIDKLLENSSKLQLLDQLVPKLLAKNHKVLIFSQFTKMLDLIEDWCDLREIGLSRLDGSVSQQEREVEINKFNTDEETKVFLLSTRAGGLGLNLTKADSVIIFDSDWNPQVDLQAMDRVHRIGQDKPVVVYRFVIANTIEQVILAKADSKRKLEKLVIQLGKFESLQRLMNKDIQLNFGSKKEASKEENQLAKELTALFEDNRFKTNGHVIEDSKLTDRELDELMDRSDEAYNRGIDYYQDEEFKHIQIFETTATLS